MGREVRDLVLHALALTVVAFLLHFTWENIQCPLFFKHGSYDASFGSMALASLGDVGITWALYATVAGVSWRWRWSPQDWSWRQWLTLIGLAIAIAWAIEAHALANHRWSYKALTPLFPGTNVSVIPVLQLLVLTPLAFWLADRLVRRLKALLSGASTRLR